MRNLQATNSGCLYLVATPIGNLDDITLRAIAILQSVDVILAEDTRHSLQLLTALGIKNNLTALHAHNELEKNDLILDQLLHGKSMALISDAGTPLIADPGFVLVRAARDKNIPVIPIPGPCALIAALSASGLPCDNFTFLGFLPAKHNARIKRLQAVMHETCTIILYESTHRITECLADIGAVFGQDCKLVLAKELTKTYENFVQGNALEITAWLTQEAGRTKGEFVIIISPNFKEPESGEDEKLLRVLLKALPLKQAVAIASQLTKSHKNALYDLALQVQGQLNP